MERKLTLRERFLLQKPLSAKKLGRETLLLPSDISQGEYTLQDYDQWRKQRLAQDTAARRIRPEQILMSQKPLLESKEVNRMKRLGQKLEQQILKKSSFESFTSMEQAESRPSRKKSERPKTASCADQHKQTRLFWRCAETVSRAQPVAELVEAQSTKDGVEIKPPKRSENPKPSKKIRNVMITQEGIQLRLRAKTLPVAESSDIQASQQEPPRHLTLKERLLLTKKLSPEAFATETLIVPDGMDIQDYSFEEYELWRREILAQASRIEDQPKPSWRAKWTKWFQHPFSLKT